MESALRLVEFIYNINNNNNNNNNTNYMHCEIRAFSQHIGHSGNIA